MGFAAGAANEDYCYLTTTGRVSGDPREIEIWFALEGRVLYMLSGGGERSHWVRNLLSEPAVSVRIGDVTQAGHARVVAGSDEDVRARALLFDKYSARYAGDLGNWRRTALPVAVDF
jgi:deazaflavin-dependent oxidoreductase (nitroreductase family)